MVRSRLSLAVELKDAFLLPPEEERALYINEYMNVVCGRIVSKINTLTDSVSKLSVPEYFGENDPDYGRDEQAYHIMLVYRNGQGFVRFIIQFEFQQNGGDDVSVQQLWWLMIPPLHLSRSRISWKITDMK